MNVMAERGALSMIVLLLATGATAGSAHGQQLRRGTLSGTLVSKSVDAQPGGPVPILTTPSSSPFILTEVCTDAMGLRLSASGFGKIPTPEQSCRDFMGIVLPRNSTISVQGSGGSITITGVVSFK